MRDRGDSSRGARPSRRQPERRFRPDYLSFAGTYQCNLTCPHCCVPIEWPDRLDIPTALRFLEDARREGIRTLGFTGGEPFLYPEFVIAVTRRAAELGFQFDKVMTNGVWFADEAELERVLTDLRDAGFTRQARPERGQVPRHPHRQAGRVLPRRPPRLRPRHDPLALLRQPVARPGTGADPQAGDGAGRRGRLVAAVAPALCWSPRTSR